MNDQQQHPDEPFDEFAATSGYEGNLEDGKYYNATVSSLVKRMMDGPNMQFPGMKVLWTFAIDGSSETVEGMTSTATGENSRAAEWLISLFGKPRYDQQQAGTPIKGDEIIGRPCMVLVQFNQKGWPRVQAVFPRQQAAAPSAPVPAAAPAPSQATENFDDLPF